MLAKVGVQRQEIQKTGDGVYVDKSAVPDSAGSVQCDLSNRYAFMTAQDQQCSNNSNSNNSSWQCVFASSSNSSSEVIEVANNPSCDVSASTLTTTTTASTTNTTITTATDASASDKKAVNANNISSNLNAKNTSTKGDFDLQVFLRSGAMNRIKDFL